MSERDELRAAIDARRELGPEYEPEIVDAFLERIERRVEERRAGKPARAGQGEHPAVTPMVLGSLALSIPLLGIAGGTAGLAGVVIVAVAIVIVNLIAIRR